MKVNESAEDFRLGINAVKVLQARYLLKDENGNIIETPRKLFRRVAKAVASIDRKYKQNANLAEYEFYEAMLRNEFMPNSPTLMNAGTPNQMLSACFVMPIPDSLDGIFGTLKDAAKIQKFGGGTGFSFSRLRPKGDIVGSTRGVSSGSVSFMRVYDMATDVIKQGSRRRGANMGILNSNHPDIMEFITAKGAEGMLKNFNISVAADDKFMKAALKGKKYALINPHSNKNTAYINARDMLELITTMAWRTGDPGMVFLDEINRRQPTPKLGKIESTNPCVIGSTLVSTERGLMKIKDLALSYPNGGIRIVTDNRVPINIINRDGTIMKMCIDESGISLNKMSKAFFSGVKDVYKLITKNGHELTATLNHKIMALEGWVELKDCLNKDVLIQYRGDSSIDRVTLIEYFGREEVYDLVEPITNSFCANGIIVHNCGEVPLLPYESCNLGSINLSRIVENKKINWDKLRRLTHLGVHFLDNVIDANKYPVKQTAEITRANRKIGLGVMGLAEMFILLGIKYDSDKALKVSEQIIKFIRKEADKASQELAKRRGSFPNLRKSRINGPKRNATVLSIAPTGTISIITETSSGIEPLFAISFVREVLEGTQLLEINPLFEKIAKEKGFYSKKLMIKISKKGSIQNFKKIPKEVRNLFVTALDIQPEWHVRMQAVFQKHVDNGISKTVNLPYDSSIEDVKKIYLLAYKLKCKGITIYRYGSKKEQVLYLGDNLKNKITKEKNVKAHSEYSGGCATGECPF